ncbi:Cthe_2314 family HEPN domain-containing protein [Schinkia sp. CFF1]
MYFNVDKKLYDKYKDEFPDLLDKAAAAYREFDNSFEEDERIILILNEHLKLFPIIDHWKTELFYQWDVCRHSLICATAIINEYCKKFKEDDYSDERGYYEHLAEYYLDNISYRAFSILEKIGHPLNILLSLDLPYRKISFFTVKTKLSNGYPEHLINKIFQELESDEGVSIEFKEYRHSLTHRDHLLQPTYGLEVVELEMGEDNGNGINGTALVNISTAKAPRLNIITLHEMVTEFYGKLTVFLEDFFIACLKELIERHKKEVDFYKQDVEESLKH